MLVETRQRLNQVQHDVGMPMSEESEQFDAMELREHGPVCGYALGVLTVKLRIPMSHSLKDKRHVVKSIVDIARNKFNTSAAQVDCLDNLQQSGLAFSFVANDPRLVNSVLDKLLDFIESNTESEVIAYDIDVSQ